MPRLPALGLCRRNIKPYSHKIDLMIRRHDNYFQGDSGSPLMCKRDGRYKLCGITSGGNQVCDPSNTDPTFFTSTPAASLMMWIRENSNIKTVGEPNIIWKLERSIQVSTMQAWL